MLGTRERYEACKRGQARVVDALANAARQAQAECRKRHQEARRSGDEILVAELEGELAEIGVEVFRTDGMVKRLQRTGKPEPDYSWMTKPQQRAKRDE